MKSGAGVTQVSVFDKTSFQKVKQNCPIPYFQELNGHRLDVIEKTDGSAALLSDDTETLHPILQNTQIDKAERHSIINIHTQMFFYCWRIINLLLLNEENQRLNRVIFPEVYEVIYKDINEDIENHLKKNPSITVEQLNAYICSQQELYSQWVRNDIAITAAEHDADLKNENFLSSDLMKISLEQDPAINNFHQIESNHSLGLITHTHGIPKSSNQNPVPIIKVEQNALTGNSPLQSHFHRPLFETLDGLPIQAQLSTLAASASENDKTSKATTYLFTPLSNKKQVKNKLWSAHSFNASPSSVKVDVLPIPAKKDSTNLNIYSSDPIVREMKLLTDIAILRSIQPTIKVDLSALDQKYTEFLKKPRTRRFFCDDSNTTTLLEAAKASFKTSLNTINLPEITTNRQKLIRVLSELYSKHFIEDADTHKVSKEQNKYAPIIQAIHMALNNKQGYERANAEQYSNLKSLADLFLAYTTETISNDIIKLEINNAVDSFINNGQDDIFATTIQEINKKYNAYGSATHASLNGIGVPGKEFINQMQKTAAAIKTLKAVKPLTETNNGAKEIITTAMKEYQTGRSWVFFSWRNHKTEVNKMLDELHQLPESADKDTKALEIFLRYKHDIKKKKNYNSSGALQETFTQLHKLGMFAPHQRQQRINNLLPNTRPWPPVRPRVGSS